MTHPHPNRIFVTQAVLTRFGKINTAGASVNTAVRPINTAGSKPTLNHPRPISKCTNEPSEEYKEKGVIDSGYSRHMTRNKCYLIEYGDYDGGFVSFGDGKGEHHEDVKAKRSGYLILLGSYEFSDSLLLTSLCCDDIHDGTSRVSALAGCDRLVLEPLVIEKSFDVIVGMDWLSKRRFVIVCHKKVVRIPLEGDEILRVHGERTQGVLKTLVNTKHEVHLKLVLELLRKEKLYVKVTYLRFIINFSKIVKPLTSLTERNQKYEWGAEREEAF
ncbi:hypothetical protein Tco_1210113 [Tanacetum coccineum]